MKDISSYLTRLNINENIKADNYSLFRFHHAHFYSVPFENFSMNENAASGSFSKIIADNIIFNKRGGICFEFAALLAPFFSYTGFVYRTRLARVLIPLLTPATHQLFIISVAGEEWIFDVGFGARGPRAPLRMVDGYVHEHAFLSSKVSRHPAYGWVVSVRENSRLNADWEDIYAFHDTETFPPDISMAYFYTLHSPESLLNIHKVASLPTENGRISIRDTVFTEVNGLSSCSADITDNEELSQLLSGKFGISIHPQQRQ
ncbi:arylamine N-acetyltransferase [Morganella sp. GD04133]|uniref:arylamine N-acetyltransferase family protein n=1 Tax=Morganella sp. GD04133 TaxID=2975435 RepID=UPI0024489EFB|nr:arylamine N-acetyltransferase [Morganella sp. GD04133]MDH0353702.1 arylamine N-acetyltransferase [Morganella sp. GD04133]